MYEKIHIVSKCHFAFVSLKMLIQFKYGYNVSFLAHFWKQHSSVAVLDNAMGVLRIGTNETLIM